MDTDEGLLASYLKRKLSAHEAVETISGCRNLILGMSAAQPPALMAATADALRDRLIGPLNVYYLHGTEHLQQTLLAPDLIDLVTPRPLFLSHSGGYERLAEVQEEILSVCEAAHVPVIWATQVLENLAQKGMPSRAEISDAVMAHRAECVMLNKGPHVIEALGVLDSILKRMEQHQTKKRALLRALRLAQNGR